MRVKGRICAALCIVLMFVHIFSAEVLGAETPVPALQSRCAILMEASTGTVLFENNADEALPPASVTKIMTLLLIFEEKNQGKFQWDDMVSVSEHAASMGGSQVFLEPDEQQTARDMVKCISVASANDASVAMAEFIGGSEESFVAMMNDKAKELGMKNTVFKNACGLDVEGHVTSARDIAIMSRELITKYPQITEFTTIWMDTITHKTRKGESEFGLANTNKLIKWYSGATGLKTGSTSAAKFCLSGTAKRDNMELIAVVMAAPDAKTRFQEVMKMLDWGFANYKVEKAVSAGEVLGKIAVEKGEKEEIDIISSEDISILSKKGDAEVQKELTIYESLKAPFEKGEKAGEIVFTQNGEEKGRCDIVAAEGCEKVNIFQMMGKIMDKWAA